MTQQGHFLKECVKDPTIASPAPPWFPDVTLLYGGSQPTSGLPLFGKPTDTPGSFL